MYKALNGLDLIAIAISLFIAWFLVEAMSKQGFQQKGTKFEAKILLN